MSNGIDPLCPHSACGTIISSPFFSSFQTVQGINWPYKEGLTSKNVGQYLAFPLGLRAPAQDIAFSRPSSVRPLKSKSDMHPRSRKNPFKEEPQPLGRFPSSFVKIPSPDNIFSAAACEVTWNTLSSSIGMRTSDSLFSGISKDLVIKAIIISKRYPQERMLAGNERFKPAQSFPLPCVCGRNQGYCAAAAAPRP